MSADADRLCRKIISISDSIRYVALVNKMGKIISSRLRKGLVPILSEQERESYAMKAVLSKMGKEDFAYKLGPLLFTTSVFKKVKRVELPLEGAEEGGDDSPALLIVSFDFQTNHEELVLQEILPLVKAKVVHVDL